MEPDQKLRALTGALLGAAVGDALGLPREGLSRRRGRRVFGETLRHRFFFGRGMCSDDTEHAVFALQALRLSGGEPEAFARALAWRLRWWLAGLPAGIGWATLRSICKLWLGFPPCASGVGSAGNGPAMRAPIIGVCAADDPAKLRALLQASTTLTHRHPKAEAGALAIALAAQQAALKGAALRADEVFDVLRKELTEPELIEKIGLVEEHLKRGTPPEAFAETLGCGRGVSGYMYHTVPAALYCWLRSPGDYRQAVSAVIALGGDTDTAGAIVGALAGATGGAEAIPTEWVAGICEWPRSSAWLRELAAGSDAKLLPLWMVPALLVRNVFFMAVVLAHGFRRLLPPY